MRKLVDECCGCANATYPCLGNSCPNRDVPHLYCDECGDDVEAVYEVDNMDLCESCLKRYFRKVEL